MPENEKPMDREKILKDIVSEYEKMHGEAPVGKEKAGPKLHIGHEFSRFILFASVARIIVLTLRIAVFFIYYSGIFYESV